MNMEVQRSTAISFAFSIESFLLTRASSCSKKLKRLKRIKFCQILKKNDVQVQHLPQISIEVIT